MIIIHFYYIYEWRCFVWNFCNFFLSHFGWGFPPIEYSVLKSVASQTMLETNKLLLRWCCICPIGEDTRQWKKNSYFICTLLSFLINLSAMISSSCFAWKYASIDLKESLYAAFQLAPEICIIYVVVTAMVFRHQIAELFEDLSTICDASKIIF